jgi:hypothetical protein
MGKQEFGLPTDTIAAISTAPGRAGISVVRVSGPEAILVAASLGVTGLTPRRCVLTAVHHPEDGRLIDRAVVTLFRPVGYGGVGGISRVAAPPRYARYRLRRAALDLSGTHRRWVRHS